MKKTHPYLPFAVSALLLWLVVCALYGWCQYAIDPDGTAYLTISARYASGDYLKAINGYWSPWGCWLTAGLMRAGCAAIPASLIINTIGATGYAGISQSLFLKFNMPRQLQWALHVALAVFLCSAVYWQSFDDIWECFFLLAALRIFLASGFIKSPALWVAAGITGALAYFSKAYAFPFFITGSACTIWLLSGKDRRLAVKAGAVTLLTFFICATPWLALLHYKYGIWTTATAGQLNMSWYLAGHPYYKSGIDLLIPAHYTDSPYYWEDPWYANGDTPHFWDSLHLAGLQALRLGLNAGKLALSLVQLSFFLPLAAWAAILWFKKQGGEPAVSGRMRVIALHLVLFPLGYALINYEARYLWYLVPLSMIALAETGVFKSRMVKNALPLSVLLAISYMIYPVYCIIKMKDEGKAEYRLAQELKKAGVHGSFTANAHPKYMARLAYFSGDQYYYLSDRAAGDSAILNEMKKYHIAHYYRFGEKTVNGEKNKRKDGAQPPVPVLFSLKTYIVSSQPAVTVYELYGN
ncbi:MAG: hypothetical protein H7257_02360 [Taibaiella sp.]|nr:hypothetical protein [Taibaiella sp.]